MSDQSEIEKLQAQEHARAVNQLALVANGLLRALSLRMMKILALLLMAFLSGWAMLQPDWIRVVTSLVFDVAAWFMVSPRQTKEESQ